MLRVLFENQNALERLAIIQLLWYVLSKPGVGNNFSWGPL